MIKIAPSILSADFCDLARDIQRVSSADWLHVDVSANDLSFYDTILMTETVTGQNHIDAAPDATEFLKELLVPGSTK